MSLSTIPLLWPNSPTIPSSNFLILQELSFQGRFGTIVDVIIMQVLDPVKNSLSMM
jgi:hypothetical protein